ncbi:MAG TPA: VOC family protein [Opitutaceae bacterium]|nr:VOC family protein [Opitutaceae bacterium]
MFNRRSLLVAPLILTLALAGGHSAFAAGQAGRNYHIYSLYHVGYWVRDIAKSRAFYKDYLGFEEPYSLNYPDGTLQMAVMKVNERQVIYLFPNAAKILPNGDNLDHLGLETDDLAALREDLLAKQIKVGEVHRGRIGDLILGVKDPDGHTFEITQLTPEGQLLQHQGRGLPATRASDRLRSATIAVADLAASVRFYRDILGFKKTSEDADTRATCMQVPNGDDFIVLTPIEKISSPTPTRGVPDYCLEVRDVAKLAERLTARAKALGFAPPTALIDSPQNGRQISVIDPDGTRVVFKEVPARS